MPRSAQFHSSEDARRIAKRRLPWMVFDYIDGAAGEEHGAKLNCQAIQDIRFRPRVLVDVSKRDYSVELFGEVKGAPYGITPMGMCNLSAPDADLMLARLAAKHSIPTCVSTVASTPLETMLEAADGNAWFQLYFSGDGTGALKLVERAKHAGYDVLVLTVDVPEVGRRPRELRYGFKMPFRIGPRQFMDFALHPHWSLATLFAGQPQLANFDGKDYVFDRTESRAAADWSYFARLRDAWPGKLVVKGVLDVEDALRLQNAGADAIQIFSHGGRQLDGAPPPILALKAIRDAIDPEYPLFYDTGIRSGEDVVKAYAMGANYVFLGRIMQYAIAAGGSAGLDKLWDILGEEAGLTLAQVGKTNFAQLNEVVANELE